MKKFFAFVMCLIVLTSIASAQTVTIDLGKLTPTEATQVLKAQKSAKEKIDAIASIPPVEQMEKWANVGESIGKAIAATCKELSVEVNDFIKTPVGKITIVMIVWKIMGDDIVDLVGGIAVWIVISSILLWSFSHFHMSKKIKTDKGEVEYIRRYEFEESDAKLGSAIVHCIAFVLITITCLYIVF